jgi:acetyl esterase/lipase
MAVIESGAVTVEEGVVYGRGGERDLLCDIYRPNPDVPSKRTAILHLPGGGFRRCNRAGVRVARPLAAVGYTCIGAEYRVLPDGVWPAPLHDVKAAIRWTRAHADELGFEPDKLVVLGHSAGARLALMACLTQNDAAVEGSGGSAGVGTDIAACVVFYPPAGSLSGHPVVGENPSASQLSSVSLLDKIVAGYPPTLLLHGTADRTVPVDASETIYAALRRVGTPVEMHLIEGVTHIFDAHEDLARASAEWIDLFVDRHVVNPRTYPSTEPPAL